MIPDGDGARKAHMDVEARVFNEAELSTIANLDYVVEGFGSMFSCTICNTYA